MQSLLQCFYAWIACFAFCFIFQMRGRSTVSYTHLDVYKRQIQGKVAQQMARSGRMRIATNKAEITQMDHPASSVLGRIHIELAHYAMQAGKDDAVRNGRKQMGICVRMLFRNRKQGDPFSFPMMKIKPVCALFVPCATDARWTKPAIRRWQARPRCQRCAIPSPKTAQSAR